MKNPRKNKQKSNYKSAQSLGRKERLYFKGCQGKNEEKYFKIGIALRNIPISCKLKFFFHSLVICTKVLFCFDSFLSKNAYLTENFLEYWEQNDSTRFIVVSFLKKLFRSAENVQIFLNLIVRRSIAFSNLLLIL